MFFESLPVVIAQHYQPPLLFFAGLFASVACCSMAVLLENRLQFAGFLFRVSRSGSSARLPSSSALLPCSAALLPLQYRRFRDELLSCPRHIDFASVEFHEIDASELRKQSE